MPRPTMNRSGTGPASIPKVICRASRCRAGTASSRSNTGAHTWCNAANASSISDWTPATLTTRHPLACLAKYPSSVVLPTPAEAPRDR